MKDKSKKIVKEGREQRIERLKAEFISLAAHQLRTPLSAVKWILRMVLDGDTGKINDEQKEFLERAYQSNERMITLINDLLNVVDIEEGRFLYKFSNQSIEGVVKMAIAKMDKLAKSRKIKIDFKKPKKPLPQIRLDAKKMELAIRNLLDNAVSYSLEKDRVTIAVSCDKINIKVMVKDEGIGIPFHQQKRVFTRFFRGDNAVKEDTEGTGLGLFICKNIIESHQGRIWFESEEGRGTTFWFTLPMKS